MEQGLVHIATPETVTLAEMAEARGKEQAVKDAFASDLYSRWQGYREARREVEESLSVGRFRRGHESDFHPFATASFAGMTVVTMWASSYERGSSLAPGSVSKQKDDTILLFNKSKAGLQSILPASLEQVLLLY